MAELVTQTAALAFGGVALMVQLKLEQQKNWNGTSWTNNPT
jgi:hypothetical protein